MFTIEIEMDEKYLALLSMVVDVDRFLIISEDMIKKYICDKINVIDFKYRN